VQSAPESTTVRAKSIARCSPTHSFKVRGCLQQSPRDTIVGNKQGNRSEEGTTETAVSNQQGNRTKGTVVSNQQEKLLCVMFPGVIFFFFITRKPRVERYPKFMSLKYEPASEPLHISGVGVT